MILIDTSVWIEYLRCTGSEAHARLVTLIKDGSELATTEIIIMEVLAGAKDDDDAESLRRLLYRCSLIHGSGLETLELGASIFRECRDSGKTVASLVDCQIAATAIENDLEVLSIDRDYESIASCTRLRLA